MSEQLDSDQVATPKTDTAEHAAYEFLGRDGYVTADFARGLERRIAELEGLVATLERSNRRIREKYDRSYP